MKQIRSKNEKSTNDLRSFSNLFRDMENGYIISWINWPVIVDKEPVTNAHQPESRHNFRKEIKPTSWIKGKLHLYLC